MVNSKNNPFLLGKKIFLKNLALGKIEHLPVPKTVSKK
jgi:hypothetical protein